jgi:hypothetical protein
MDGALSDFESSLDAFGLVPMVGRVKGKGVIDIVSDGPVTAVAWSLVTF